jgi:hypothetical protein
MTKKKNTLPKKCICGKLPNETFEHRIGFIGGIFLHVLAALYFISGLLDSQAGKLSSQRDTYYFLAWAAFLTVWFAINYFEFKKLKHTSKCSRRYALFNLFFIKR